METPVSGETSGRGRAWPRAGIVLVLFVVFWLYVWLRIGPHLLYQQQCPVFLTTLDFLKGHLDRPGGPLAYASTFLGQFNCFPALGALILTAAAALVCWSTDGLLKAFAGRRAPLPVVLVPALGLLLLLNRYQYDPGTGLALLAALASAYAYIRLAPQKALPALTVFVVSSPVVYALGGSAYALYAVLCGAFEIVKRRNALAGAVCLAGAAAPFAFSMYSYEVSPPAAYAPLLPIGEGLAPSLWMTRPGLHIVPLDTGLAPALRAMPALSRALQAALVLFFPLAAVAVGVYARRRRENGSGERGGNGDNPKRRDGPHSRRGLLAAGLLGLLAIVALLWSFDGAAKAALEIDYYAERGQWERVLESADRLPHPLWTVAAAHDVDRALYHTGRLLDDLFRYPHRYDLNDLMLGYMGGRMYLETAGLYLELGHVNRAQVMAYYALESLGPHPEVLRVLAKVYTLKGQAAMARTCLGALRQNLLCRSEAQAALARLEADPEMKSDEEIRRLRSVMIREDSIDAPEYWQTFQILLQANPDNRMAFDYAVAYYLWSGQMEKALAGFGRLAAFGYKRLPRYCEEAAAFYAHTHPGYVANLYGGRISDETARRCREFHDEMNRFSIAGRMDWDRAREALERPYGDSYFFFCYFGYCASGPKPGPQTEDAVTGATK